jgi:hypothetical protein
LFNRFKEKLAGFKDSLSSKIQEKVNKAEDKPAATKNDQKPEAIAGESIAAESMDACPLNQQIPFQSPCPGL